MPYIRGYASGPWLNSYSSYSNLFGSYNSYGNNSKNSSLSSLSGLSSINFSDYSIISSGTYRKLMNAYYSDNTSAKSTLKAKDNPSALTSQTATTMSSTIKDVMKDSLWEKKEFTETDEKTGEKTVKQDYDREAIGKALKKFTEDYNKVGAYISEKLLLPNFPYRVECYDISHIQGTNTVASMVVFINGLPAKSEYRKFKIKSTEGKPDDFTSMKEVLTRRLSRLDDKNFPDLIIIDGGKGQLSSVMAVIQEMNIKGLNVVSLAKREEEIFVPNQSKPVIFPKNSEQLYFFQRIRDEAHRFAITYHRKLREKSGLESLLDNIKGISEKSKKIIRKNFSDIKKLSQLTLPEIALLIPPSQAERVYRQFRDKSDGIIDNTAAAE